MVERLGLESGKTVVDVGAGTGKLTRQLVPSGARVLAVEPLAEMRAQLDASVPEAEALAGTAEALPLENGGVDAITVASAMHWFDTERALSEFHRVLSPGGGLAILGNARDLADPLQAAVQEIIGQYLPKLDELLAWIPELETSPLFGPLETTDVAWEQFLDAEGLAERIGTISYVARLPDEERAGVLEKVRRLGEAQPGSSFPFRYRTGALVCSRRDADYPLPE